MTSPLVVLAIDLGSRSGWATPTASGAVDFRGSDYEIALDRHAALFDRFSLWLSDMIDQHQPAVVVLEKNPALGRLIRNAAPTLLGLRAIAAVVAYRREILLDELPSAGRRSPDKSDENDAKALLARWMATRAHLVREAA